MSFPPWGLLCLFHSLKLPSSHPQVATLLSTSCLPFTVGLLERVVTPTVFTSSSYVTPHLLGLLSHSAEVALLKMICAYSSHGPVTIFHSSPSIFSLAYEIIVPDPVTLPPDHLSNCPLWDLPLWHLFTVCPSLPCWQMQIFHNILSPGPQSFCIFLFSHLLQTHVCAVSTSLLKLRSILINAISTGIPENTSTASMRKFILLSGSSSWFPYFCEWDCHALSSGTKDLSHPGLIILLCLLSPPVS